MVLDTSAVLAIALREPGAQFFLNALSEAESIRVSAATLVEIHLVSLGKKSPRVESDVQDLLRALGVQIVPFTQEMAAEARQAFVKYGKGRHRASLNFGDCISYATAKVLDELLMCKGHDFAQTDLRIVAPPN